MTPVGEDAGERPRKRRLVLEIEARATECGPCVGRVANHCRPFADLLEYRVGRYMRVDACRAAEQLGPDPAAVSEVSEADVERYTRIYEQVAWRNSLATLRGETAPRARAFDSVLAAMRADVRAERGPDVANEPWPSVSVVDLANDGFCEQDATPREAMRQACETREIAYQAGVERGRADVAHELATLLAMPEYHRDLAASFDRVRGLLAERGPDLAALRAAVERLDAEDPKYIANSWMAGAVIRAARALVAATPPAEPVPLDTLVARARQVPVTPEHREEQARAFAASCVTMNREPQEPAEAGRAPYAVPCDLCDGFGSPARGQVDEDCGQCGGTGEMVVGDAEGGRHG